MKFNVKYMCLLMASIILPSAVPILRRSLALFPRSVDDMMKKISFDPKSSSNSDIILITSHLSKGRFKHPRAKQMSAAARYGWKFTPQEAFCPEHWMASVHEARLLFVR